MALQPCGECGELVSDVAETCPKCGVPDPCGTYADAAERRLAAEQQIKNRFWIGFAVVLAILLLPCFIGLGRNALRPRPDHLKPPTPEELKAARDRVEKLKSGQ
jgi:hypothetical protein